MYDLVYIDDHKVDGHDEHKTFQYIPILFLYMWLYNIEMKIAKRL